MTPTVAVPFRYRWFSRGDINGFFALAIDNIALLVGMSGILIGVFHLPPDVVMGRMVPGTAIFLRAISAFKKFCFATSIGP